MLNSAFWLRHKYREPIE